MRISEGKVLVWRIFPALICVLTGSFLPCGSVCSFRNEDAVSRADFACCVCWLEVESNCGEKAKPACFGRLVDAKSIFQMNTKRKFYLGVEGAERSLPTSRDVQKMDLSEKSALASFPPEIFFFGEIVLKAPFFRFPKGKK